MSELLECENLSVGYLKPNKKLIENFSFVLNEGEVVSLMGTNGCGKSTLLKTFAGSEPALAGSLKLLGRQIADWPLKERATKIGLVRMGTIPTNRMTVREFVGLGRMPYTGILDGRSENDERIVDDAIVLLNLKGFEGRCLNELSDGERSRVYLAMAVSQQVKVLLLDEPNAFLDIPHSHALFRLLRELARKQGVGIVVSTHSLEYANRYTDRMIVVDGGRAQVATPMEALKRGFLDWTEMVL